MNLLSGNVISYNEMNEQFISDLISFINLSCYNIEGSHIERESEFTNGTVLKTFTYSFDRSKMPFSTPTYNKKYKHIKEGFPFDKYKHNRSLTIEIDDDILKLGEFTINDIKDDFNEYISQFLPNVLTNKIITTQDIVKYYNLCNYFLQKRIVRLISYPPNFYDSTPEPEDYQKMHYFYSTLDVFNNPETIQIRGGTFNKEGRFDNYSFILDAINVRTNLRTVNCKINKH